MLKNLENFIVHPDTFPDVERLSVCLANRTMSTDRINGFIEQIGNPYCYLDDGVVVEIGYANTQVSLQERLVSYASSINQDFGNMR